MVPTGEGLPYVSIVQSMVLLTKLKYVSYYFRPQSERGQEMIRRSSSQQRGDQAHPQRQHEPHSTLVTPLETPLIFFFWQLGLLEISILHFNTDHCNHSHMSLFRIVQSTGIYLITAC